VETYVLALGDGGEVDLDLGLGEHVGGGGHVDEEVWRAAVSWCAVSITRDPRPIRKFANCCPGGARGPYLAVPTPSSPPASRRGVEASYLAQSPSRQAQTARPWFRP
jgi:hypothetical protein